MANGFGSLVRVLAVAGAIAAGALAGPAAAVTISDGVQLSKPAALDLSGFTTCGSSGSFSTSLGGFTGAGAPGSGTASCGDKTTVQVKDEASPFPYGRFNPAGGKWIDSNDLAHVTWELNSPVGLTALSFALTDAHDQRDSHFEIAVGGATWSIPTREANGTLRLISILFDAPTRNATITFDTRLNDGYGISDVRVAPVPLPPALALMAPGLLLLGALRRRKPRAA